MRLRARARIKSRGGLGLANGLVHEILTDLYKEEMAVSKEKREELAERMQRLGIYENDLIEKFILGGGPGGQKVNKTASTVYLKHVPTAIEVKCSKDRSQEINRFLARRTLCEKFEMKLGIKTPKEKEIEKIKKQKKRKARKSKIKLYKKLKDNLY